jgi:hypothetical protein
MKYFLRAAAYRKMPIVKALYSCSRAYKYQFEFSRNIKAHTYIIHLTLISVTIKNATFHQYLRGTPHSAPHHDQGDTTS